MFLHTLCAAYISAEHKHHGQKKKWRHVSDSELHKSEDAPLREDVRIAFVHGCVSLGLRYSHVAAGRCSLSDLEIRRRTLTSALPSPSLTPLPAVFPFVRSPPPPRPFKSELFYHDYACPFSSYFALFLPSDRKKTLLRTRHRYVAVMRASSNT